MITADAQADCLSAVLGLGEFLVDVGPDLSGLGDLTGLDPAMQTINPSGTRSSGRFKRLNR